MAKFTDLGLSPNILKSLDELGYENATPIQVKAIPHVLEGKDVMGLAQTGTGKTAAFGLPLTQKLLKEALRPDPKTVRALILAPTRELVNQIAVNLKTFTRNTPVRVTSVVGGASIHVQTKNLAKGIDILVATPGRLLDLLDRRALSLNAARFLVLDEADQMLDLGFIHDLKKIAKLIPKNRQTMLFSATMPKQIEDLSKTYLTDPIRVEASPPGKAADKIQQSVHFVSQNNKTELLKKLLAESDTDISLVFSRTKHGAEKLMKHLVSCNFPAGSIHGNKSQGQRDRAIAAFKSREIRILVATDVAARGIDIQGVTHVYNYDLPEVADNYVHRIGRTARAGASGKAVAFCAPAEFHLFKDIQKLMKIEISVEGGSPPDLDLANAERDQKNKTRQKSHQGRHRDGAVRSRKKNPAAANGKPKNTKSDGGRPRGGASKPSSGGNKGAARPAGAKRSNNRRKP